MLHRKLGHHRNHGNFAQKPALLPNLYRTLGCNGLGYQVRGDDEWEKMYMNDNGGNKEENGSSVNGGGEEDGEEEEEEESEEEEEEEIEAKKSNGKGRSSAEKQKATQDDQPMATTRSKRIKVSDSKDHQGATQSRKKAMPKNKHSRK